MCESSYEISYVLRCPPMRRHHRAQTKKLPWLSQSDRRTNPAVYPNSKMSMNIFRLCGDMSHVFSIIVLLLRLRVAKNASGEQLHGFGPSLDLYSGSPTSSFVYSYCKGLFFLIPNVCEQFFAPYDFWPPLPSSIADPPPIPVSTSLFALLFV